MVAVSVMMMMQMLLSLHLLETVSYLVKTIIDCNAIDANTILCIFIYKPNSNSMPFICCMYFRIIADDIFLIYFFKTSICILPSFFLS